MNYSSASPGSHYGVSIILHKFIVWKFNFYFKKKISILWICSWKFYLFFQGPPVSGTGPPGPGTPIMPSPQGSCHSFHKIRYLDHKPLHEQYLNNFTFSECEAALIFCSAFVLYTFYHTLNGARCSLLLVCFRNNFRKIIIKLCCYMCVYILNYIFKKVTWVFCKFIVLL